jgi:hypothetical protein
VFCAARAAGFRPGHGERRVGSERQGPALNT